MESEGRCFTFVWKLEDAIFYLREEGKCLESPPFVVNAIEGTKWRLLLILRNRGSKIDYYLHREEDDRGRDIVEIKYQLAFFGTDGRVVEKSNVSNGVFSKGTSFGNENMPTYFNFDSNHNRFNYSPSDTVSLRCRIWKKEEEMTEDVTCTVTTRVGVEKRTFQGHVNNFSTQRLGNLSDYQLESVPKDLFRMFVDLFSGFDYEEIIRFELSLQDQTIKLVFLRFFILNDSKNMVHFGDRILWFNDPVSTKRFIFSLSKKILLDKRSIYLPDDTLSLVWDCWFSRGTYSEETEEDEHGCICSEVKTSDAQNSRGDQKTLSNNFEKTDDCSYEERFLHDIPRTLVNAFSDDLKCLYDEEFLSDVKLKTETREFPAHKFMLSASSSVFKAMFSNDMKEKISDCVYIEDLDDDTVSRMLHFMYSRRVEDLTWENSSKLYAAADKYASLSLKSVCSSFLKEHLSPSNAPDALLLADLHADDDLKSVVQDYIIENIKQITKSEEWKTLMKANGTLAAETMCKLFG